eukprot:COSAG05_NODE_1177_length_5608_cov_21.882011_1_plen_837_part_00
MFKLAQHNIRDTSVLTNSIQLRRPTLAASRSSCRSFADSAMPMTELRRMLVAACRCLRKDSPLTVYIWVNIPLVFEAGPAGGVQDHRQFEVTLVDGNDIQLLPLAAEDAEAVPSMTALLASDNLFASNASVLVSMFTKASVGDDGKRSALLLAGRIAHALTVSNVNTSKSTAIGVCPIGGLDNTLMRRVLGLHPGAEFLHALAVGVRGEPSRSPSAAPQQQPPRASTDQEVVGHSVTATQLTAYAAARVPTHMVPKSFRRLDTLPLNTNGKIDRAKLMAMPQPTAIRDDDSSLDMDRIASTAAPRNATEGRIAGIWKGVLQLAEPVGIFDRFDELAESRNLFTRVILRRIICDVLNQNGLKVEQSAVFSCETVAELARIVDGKTQSEDEEVEGNARSGSAEGSADQLAIESRLLTIFRDVLRRGESELGAKDDFFLAGGDSLLAVGATLQIRKKLGNDIPFTMIFKHRTAAALAPVLRQASLADASIVLIQKGTRADHPLFLVHPALRTTLTYNRVVENLDEGQTVYGLEDHRSPDQRCAYDSLEQMALFYANCISLMVPEGCPVLLGGWSFGAVLAFEIAQQLQASGRAVPLLLLLEVAPTSALGWFPSQLPKTIDQLDLSAQLKHLMAVSMAVWYAFPARSMAGVCTVDPAKLAQASSSADRLAYMYDHLLKDVLPLETGLVYLRQFINDYVESEQLLLGYLPRPYHGQVVLFSGTDGAKSSADVHTDSGPTGPVSAAGEQDGGAGDATAPHRGWAMYTDMGSLDVVLTPGNHDNLLLPPHVTTTALLLKDVLQRHGFHGTAMATDVDVDSIVAHAEEEHTEKNTSTEVWKLNK